MLLRHKFEKHIPQTNLLWWQKSHKNPLYTRVLRLGPWHACVISVTHLLYTQLSFNTKMRPVILRSSTFTFLHAILWSTAYITFNLLSFVLEYICIHVHVLLNIKLRILLILHLKFILRCKSSLRQKDSQERFQQIYQNHGNWVLCM